MDDRAWDNMGRDDRWEGMERDEMGVRQKARVNVTQTRRRGRSRSEWDDG